MTRGLALIGILAASALLVGCTSQEGDPEASPPDSPVATETDEAEPPPTLAESVKNVGPGVVRIEVTRCDGSVGSGSGFFIDSQNIANVEHVVGGARTISLRVGEKITRAELVGWDRDRDLALIRATNPIGNHNFQFANGAPSELQEVAILGFPLGLPLTSTQGTVSALNRTVELEDNSIEGMIQTDAAINPGNSGGPMINSRGRVLGLVESGYNEAQGLSYAVPATSAGPTLESWAGRSEVIPLEECLDPYRDSITIDSIHADAPAIGASLATYFEAINRGFYEDAWELLTGDQRGKFDGIESFETAYSTTYVDKLRLKLSDGISETANTADVSFRSFQDAEFGVDGSTCTRWNLRYTMKINAGYWQIAGAKNLGASPTNCPGSLGE